MDWNLFWTAFGAIGGSLGAIATSIAVIVALWQTKVTYKKALKLSFSDSIVLVAENGGNFPRYVGVNVVNTGNRDVIIQNWGFKLNNDKRIIIINDSTPLGKAIQPPLPHRLGIEESVDLYYQQKLFYQILEENYEKQLLDLNKKLEWYVVDSTGKQYSVFSDKIIKEYIEKNS